MRLSVNLGLTDAASVAKSQLVPSEAGNLKKQVTGEWFPKAAGRCRFYLIETEVNTVLNWD